MPHYNKIRGRVKLIKVSEETAAGDHPVLVLETMSRIVSEVEASELYWKQSDLPPVDLGISTNAVAHAAVAAAAEITAGGANLSDEAAKKLREASKELRELISVFNITIE